MNEHAKTLGQILRVPEALALEEAIRARGDNPFLDELHDREKAMYFLRSSLCGSYLFARFTVPSYVAAVFSSLTEFHPADDEVGTILLRLMEAVSGELFNNNIFQRPGECHAHYNDMREAYEAAGGDPGPWQIFLERERVLGLEVAMAECPIWTENSVRYARHVLACRDDPLALFILLPANEEFAPRLYARSLASLQSGGPFDKLRRFLEAHVALDQDDHGPAFLDWLDVYLRRTAIPPERVADATSKVLRLFGG